MRKIATAALFRAVQALLFPIAALAYIPSVMHMVAYSHRTGVSATVLGSLYTRYMQHRLHTRRDEAAGRVTMVMPNVPHLGWHLLTAPTLAAHRLTRYVPRIYRYPYQGVPPMNHRPAARTTFYDQVLERHLADVEQLVVLGAGFDTRAYRLPEDAGLGCFEVDQPQTQAFKREMLRRAGVDSRRVTYVAADLEQKDWFEQLADAGFAPGERSVFLWESVTMSLDREAVESTLRKIAETAPGTIVAFDYVSTGLVASRSPFMCYTRAVLRVTGEPWRFGIENTPPARNRVAAFLESCGLALEEHRTFGAETNRKGAPAGFATAIVPRRGERAGAASATPSDMSAPSAPEKF